MRLRGSIKSNLAILTLLMFMLSLVSIAPVQATGLTFGENGTPPSTEFSNTVAEVVYEVDETIDPENVHLYGNLSNGILTVGEQAKAQGGNQTAVLYDFETNNIHSDVTVLNTTENYKNEGTEYFLNRINKVYDMSGGKDIKVQVKFSAGMNAYTDESWKNNGMRYLSVIKVSTGEVVANWRNDGTAAGQINESGKYQIGYGAEQGAANQYGVVYTIPNAALEYNTVYYVVCGSATCGNNNAKMLYAPVIYEITTSGEVGTGTVDSAYMERPKAHNITVNISKAEDDTASKVEFNRYQGAAYAVGPAITSSIVGWEIPLVVTPEGERTYDITVKDSLGNIIPFNGFEGGGPSASSFGDIRFTMPNDDVTVDVTFKGLLLPMPVLMAAGPQHTLVLRHDGTIFSCGNNNNGKLGDGTSFHRQVPVQVKDLSGVISVSAGNGHSVALKEDGTVWTWGHNYNQQLGYDGSESRIPTQVPGISGAAAVAARTSYTAVLKNNGTVWTFGQNKYGQLGDGTTTDRLTPMQVPGLNDVTILACGGMHMMALQADGSLWTWGWNRYGQLGDGTTTDSPNPAKIMDGVIDIAAGHNHAVALKNDGTVWAWGENTCGQLGNGSMENSSVPVKMEAAPDRIKSIRAGLRFTVIYTEDGTIWTCGSNKNGQLGRDNGGSSESLLAQVEGLTDIAAISTGQDHVLVMKNNGEVWGWGQNFASQLGNGDAKVLYQPSPVRMLLVSDSSPTLVQATGEDAKITLKFSKAMAYPAGVADPAINLEVFNVKVNGNDNLVTAIALGEDTTKIVLTLTTPINKGDQVTISYTMGSAVVDNKYSIHGTVVAVDGDVLASFTNQPVLLTAPVLTPDTTDNIVGQAVEITFSDDETWCNAISEIKVGDTVLESNQYTKETGKITIAAGVFTEAKDYTIIIKATGYSDATVIQTLLTEVAYTAEGTITAITPDIVTFADDKFTVPAGVTGFTFKDGAKKMKATFADNIWTIVQVVEAGKDDTIPIDSDTPVIITVPSGVTNTGIQVTQNTPLPTVNVQSTQVDMTIPEGTEVSGSDTIKLPEVMISFNVNVPAAQQVDLVIKVGSDLGTITFTKPVRLVLKGQATKSAGFIDNQGNFQEIKKLASLIGLTSDTDADAANTALTSARVGEGAVAYGNDLIIWTKHFTEFVTYTPKTSSGGSTSGGGGPITPSGQTIGSKGGTIKEAGAEVSFPADAVNSDIKVTIKKLSAGIPSVPSGLNLLGEVYEISSSTNNTFKKPVTITLPFDPDEVDNDKHDVGIYCWSSQWVILEQVKVDLKAGKVRGEVNHFSKFAVLLSEKSATDTPLDEDKEPTKDVIAPVKATLKDITGHWAEANINQLVNAEAVSGYPDGTFKPDNTITRAEFATILVKAFNLEAKSGKVFSDTTGHWAKDAISTAASHGIVSGYSETTFGPDNLITREQMAVMIVKAAKLAEVQEGKTFADGNKVSAWAKNAVATAGEKNIISGYPDNTFRPQNNATRAEAATVIIKSLKLAS